MAKMTNHPIFFIRIIDKKKVTNEKSFFLTIMIAKMYACEPSADLLLQFHKCCIRSNTTVVIL